MLIKTVSEPWFTLIYLGIKTREGRLIKGDFANIRKNDIIKFINDDFGFPREVHVRVTSIKKYTSFDMYLKGEGLSKCLPGVNSLANGVQIYHKYYTKEQEAEHGVVSIRFVHAK
jgi:ASC-1-like (ASCH) protein